MCVYVFSRWFVFANVNDNSNSPRRPNRLFLPFAELTDNSQKVRNGLELEFNVCEEQGKLCAVRASILPEGTVSFFELLPDVHQGTVHREMRRDTKRDTRREARNGPRDIRREKIRFIP